MWTTRLRVIGLLIAVGIAAVVAALFVPLPNLAPPTPTPCPLVWAQEDYPDLTATYRERLEAAQVPVTNVRAYGFGEAACDSMLPRQTDFDVTISYASDAPASDLANWVEVTLLTLTDIPATETPGPNPGRAVISLQSDVGVQTLLVQLTQVYAYSAAGDTTQSLVEALGLQDDLLFVE